MFNYVLNTLNMLFFCITVFDKGFLINQHPQSNYCIADCTFCNCSYIDNKNKLRNTMSDTCKSTYARPTYVRALPNV